MINTSKDQDGFLIIKIILIAAIMIAGYIIIGNALESDKGKDAVETVNSAKEQADKVLNN